MNSKIQQFLTVVSFFVAMVLIVPAAQAQSRVTINSIDLYSFDNPATCAETTLISYASYSSTSNGNYVGLTLHDGNGTAIRSTWLPVDQVAYGSISSVFNHGTNINPIAARPLTLRWHDLNSTYNAGNPPPANYNSQATFDAFIGLPVLASFVYDPADDVAACNSLPLVGVVQPGPSNAGGSANAGGPVPLDERINAFDAAAPVAVYAVDGSLVLYEILPNSRGVLAVVVTAEQIAAMAAPEQNALLGSNDDGSITVWRLSSGEFQVNAFMRPGVTYIMRFHAVRPNAAYESFEVSSS